MHMPPAPTDKAPHDACAPVMLAALNNRYLRPILLRALIAWMPRSWRPAVRVWGAVIKVK